MKQILLTIALAVLAPFAYAQVAETITTATTESRGTMTITNGNDSPRTVASRYDFNGDGYPDFVLIKPIRGGSPLVDLPPTKNVIWYLRDNLRCGPPTCNPSTRFGPEFESKWALIDEADFNHDGHPDFVLFDPETLETKILYMRGGDRVGSRPGPRIPNGWRLQKVGDFNGDGWPDYVLTNGSPTYRTAIWYMHDNQEIPQGRGPGPTLMLGWDLVAVADFDSDGIDDYVLFRTSNSQGGPTKIWYIRNRQHVEANGPTIVAGWRLRGAADFNKDGHPDYLLVSTSGARTAIWYLDNNQFIPPPYSRFGPDIPSNNGWLYWLPSGWP